MSLLSRLSFSILSLACCLNAQSIDSLRDDISEVLEGKDATVGVAILGPNPGDVLSINGAKRMPMQSVFKYHLALAALDKVDKGMLGLSEKIEITREDLDIELWSPIRKKYPEGVELPLSEILKYTVAYSDNVGCDLLFRMLGGPKAVEAYLHQAGIKDVAIVYNEVTMQEVWERQYENWTTAEGANVALKLFFENKEQLLSPSSHDFLWETMRNSATGKKTIKGQLPKGTVVAHKTGHSGKNEEGLTGAQNDIGIVFLPNGERFYLSVLVSDSRESSSVNQKIIADIARLAWDHFVGKQGLQQ